MNLDSPASPVSNSWLPKVIASKQTVFITAASASPSLWVKYKSPVRASPACSLMTLVLFAASSLMAAATRANPPIGRATYLAAPAALDICSVVLSASRREWWSLMCSSVKVMGGSLTSEEPPHPVKAMDSRLAPSADLRRVVLFMANSGFMVGSQNLNVEAKEHFLTRNCDGLMKVHLVWEKCTQMRHVLLNFARFRLKNAFTLRTLASCVSRRWVVAK